MTQVTYTPEEIRLLFQILCESGTVSIITHHVANALNLQGLYEGYYTEEDTLKYHLRLGPIHLQKNDTKYRETLLRHPTAGIIYMSDAMLQQKHAWPNLTYSYRKTYQDLYETPLERMPLWINRPLQKYYAQWRLRIGK